MLMATLDQDKSFFKDWIIQQQQDSEELLQVLNSCSPGNEKLQSLVKKGIHHFKIYNERRALVALKDAPSLLSPPWCSPFEQCFLWLGGFRASLSIRLVYTLSDAEFDAQLSEFLKGERKGNLGEITSDQLTTINSLRCKIVEEEDQLSTRMANLQDDIADIPFRNIVARTSNDIAKSHHEVLDNALAAHFLSLAQILSGADKLRLESMKELLLNILTPLQAVELLLATESFNLSMHEWGQTLGTSRN